MTEHRCVVCPQLRAGEPRIYDRPHACDGCRSRVRTLLADISGHYADLTLEKGSTGGAKVSGSRTPPLPLSVAALDLTMPPGRPGTVSSDLVPLYDAVQVQYDVYLPARPTLADEYPTTQVTMTQRQRRRDALGWLAYGLSGDQVGEPSAPAVLDSWARDWQTYRGETLPEPTVDALTTWLFARVDWACDEHPAVDDFAAELHELAGRLRPRGARAELKAGVPCRDCDRVTLYRWPGSDYVECGSCPALLSPDEYQRWTELISSREHQPWVRAVVAGQHESSSRCGP